MARQKREQRDTRQLIVEHAAEQFALWGYAGASISDIAAAVGVSKPTLYHHFADKEEIYVEIATSVLTSMTERARAAIEGVAPAPERLRRFMRAHAGYLQENEHAYIAGQLGFRGLRETEGRSRALELRDGYERLLSGILSEGLSDGSLHMADVRTATLMVLSTLNWMARWYRSDGPVAAVEFADRYCDMLLQGFLPRAETR
ncbi:TetR/AcrR family transcriptional regulator [Roseomonas populi]|uniref:TetR/AcrR family transcriptional regulator n=1 Tax=Roseomonas populi TaxID=3121582 RepID=A0ABT1WYZ8_9PROT|nr:TetR/AcrR family transcriptional regulator [Roseomonas pecuniae]MCR0981075.1 TetR/AcrR family transcriptional regulator [Roseomonas pecuniae]